MSKISFKEIIKRAVAVLTVASMALVMGCGSSGDDAGSSAAPEETAQSSADSEETSEVAIASDSFEGKWMMVRYASGDTVIEYDQLGSAGMTDNTYFDLKADGSGTFSMAGSPMDVKFHDGKVSVSGVDLYSYTFAEPDVLEVDMAGSIYTMAREGSASLTAYQGVTTASSDNLYAVAGRDKTLNEDYYEPRDDEIEYKLDGGRCFYTTRDSVDGLIAYIKWIYVDTEDFYIPTEIDGATVVRFGCVNGHITNLYIPGTIKYIGYHACSEIWNVEGLKNIYFGYGDYPVTKYIDVLHFADHTKDVEKIVFSDYLTEDVADWFIMAVLDTDEGYPNLKEVVNMPETLKYGVAGHEALLEYLNSRNPKEFVKPQSETVTNLALELTKDCKTDEEKVWNISEWVTDNITYDHYEMGWGLYGTHIYDYGNPFEREQEPEDLIKNRIGVCEGYAKLTRALCNAVDIPAVYVSGVTKDVSHAYNAIYVNGEWQLHDNCENDTDYNGDLSLRTDKDYFGISYETYMKNEELQQAYTWEEIEALQKEVKEEKGTLPFAQHHPCYNASVIDMGSYVIPRSVEGKTLEYEHPDLEEFIDATGQYENMREWFDEHRNWYYDNVNN